MNSTNVDRNKLFKSIIILNLIYSFVQIFTECLPCAWHSARHVAIPSGKKNGVGLLFIENTLKNKTLDIIKNKFFKAGAGKGRANFEFIDDEIGEITTK